MQSKREFGFIVRVLGSRGNTVPVFLGTGMLVAPEWVLTCKHVVFEEDPLGRLTDGPVYNFSVQSGEGTQISARRPLTDPNWDLALLKLDSNLTADPPPLLWGITEAQERELRICPLSAFGYTQVEQTGPLWQHQVKDLLLLPSYREPSGTLTQIQLRGGIPAGCSGGPVLLPLGAPAGSMRARFTWEGNVRLPPG